MCCRVQEEDYYSYFQTDRMFLIPSGYLYIIFYSYVITDVHVCIMHICIPGVLKTEVNS